MRDSCKQGTFTYRFSFDFTRASSDYCGRLRACKPAMRDNEDSTLIAEKIQGVSIEHAEQSDICKT